MYSSLIEDRFDEKSFISRKKKEKSNAQTNHLQRAIDNFVQKLCGGFWKTREVNDQRVYGLHCHDYRTDFTDEVAILADGGDAIKVHSHSRRDRGFHSRRWCLLLVADTITSQ